VAGWEVASPLQLSNKFVTQEVRPVGEGHGDMLRALAAVEEQLLQVGVQAALLGWFDLSSAIHGMRIELRAWNSDLLYDKLEEEEARRGQLRLAGESMGRRHDAPLEDLPF
jgi:hypothetical protein